MNEQEPAPEGGRACQHCGGPIPAGKQATAKFCSVACRKKANGINERERIKANNKPENHSCLRCGGAIPATIRADAKFCCSTCRSDHWAEENPEAAAKARKRAEANSWKKEQGERLLPVKGNLAIKRRMLQAAKTRASRKGLLFNLTTDDIHIPDICPVLGIELSYGIGRPHDGSPSLDKIVPAMGYTRGNCEVISHRANTLKSNATVTEMRALADYYEQKLSKNWMVPNGET